MTPRSLAAIAALVTVGLTAATLHSVSGQAPRGTCRSRSRRRSRPRLNLSVSATVQFQALNISDLRGKVVLVDFWTYGCVNCGQHAPARHRTLCEI